MRILVVDDEKTLVKGMKFNLENEGYEVECAYDGAAAHTHFYLFVFNERTFYQAAEKSKQQKFLEKKYFFEKFLEMIYTNG